MKMFDGTIEIIGGVLLYFTHLDYLANLVRSLFQHELLQDPKDLIANITVAFFKNLSWDSKTFAAIYLISYGLIKVGLMASLWRNKIRAYPIAGFILSIFAGYQLFRLALHFSFILLFLTILDLLILYLLYEEYHGLKKKN